jgi:hypothetical protein
MINKLSEQDTKLWFQVALNCHYPFWLLYIHFFVCDNLKEKYQMPYRTCLFIKMSPLTWFRLHNKHYQILYEIVILLGIWFISASDLLCSINNHRLITHCQWSYPCLADAAGVLVMRTVCAWTRCYLNCVFLDPCNVLKKYLLLL